MQDKVNRESVKVSLVLFVTCVVSELFANMFKLKPELKKSKNQLVMTFGQLEDTPH